MMYKQLSELLAAARLISRSSGAKIKELEEHLGISRRSVYRLLDTLEELGYPIYDEFDGKERVIRLNEDRDNLRWWLPFPKLHFSREDMVLLEFLFREAAGTPAIAGEIARLKEKLAPILAEGGYALTTMGAPDWNRPTILHSPWITRPCSETTNQHVKTILQGIQEKTVCIVSYRAISSETVKTFRIHPLTLIERQGSVYLFVFIPYYQDIRILAVERIKEIELTEDSFEIPSYFNPTPWLQDPFGIILGDPFTARVQFCEEQAPYIKELAWPEGSSLEDQKDGSLILTVRTAGAYELKRWVMSFGSAAQLLEPDYLRNEIIEELKASLETYSNYKGNETR